MGATLRAAVRRPLTKRGGLSLTFVVAAKREGFQSRRAVGGRKFKFRRLCGKTRSVKDRGCRLKYCNPSQQSADPRRCGGCSRRNQCKLGPGIWRRCAASILALAVLLPSVELTTQVAMAATDEERVAARSLAQAGVTAFGEGRYADAIDSLSRAETLIHSPVHLLYIARAQEKLGQLVGAHESYLKVTKEPVTDSSPAVFSQAVSEATTELEALRPRIPKLTVLVSAPAGVTPELSIDGEVISSALIGVPFPIDPGQHEVSARADGATSASEGIQIAEATTPSLELALDPLPVEPTAPADVPPVAADAPPPAHDPTMSYVAYGSLGVGVLGVALGTYMLVDGLSLRSDSDDKFDACNPSGCSDSQIEEIDRLGDDSASSLSWSAVGYTVGGLGIAAGVTLLLLDSDDEPQANEPELRPWVGAGTVGVRGSF